MPKTASETDWSPVSDPALSDGFDYINLGELLDVIAAPLEFSRMGTFD